jgi:ABC-type branched-subunit amino acid transport system ATPase component
MRNFLETEEYFWYIATHGYVFQKGEIVIQGNKAQLYENDIIKKAYLRG